MEGASGARALALAVASMLTCVACGQAGSPVERAEDQRLPAAQELFDALASGEPASRARAALAMGRIQHASYTPALVSASGTGEPREVREAALFALGQLGLARGAEPSAEAVEACRAAVADADPAVAAVAVEALGKLGQPSTAELLTTMLQHETATVRAEAAHALFRLRFVPVWRGEADEAPGLPDTAIEGLVAALGDPDPGVRGAAAHAFARHAEPRATSALVSVLDDQSSWVRLWALRGLGRIGDAGVVDAVAARVADPDPRIRTSALAALAALDSPAKAPPAVMFDDNFQVRTAAARLWRLAEDEPSIEFLRRLSQDASPTVKGEAIEALAERLGDRWILGLEFYEKDPAWPVRAAVASASALLPEKGLEFTLRLLNDDDPRVQTAALEALRERPNVERHIVRALDSDDLALRGTAVGLVSGGETQDKLGTLQRVYEASAGSQWIEVRESIVDALADLDGADELLETIYRDDDASSVRARARQVLERAGRDLPDVEPAPITPSRRLGKRFTEDPVIVIETSKGTIEIRAFADAAPVHVASFVALVEEGFYDGLAWHRVVPNFVIQGGDPRGDGWGSGGIVLRDEINRRRFDRGTVGMPKAGKDTGGCQLFITHVPTPHLDGNYTVFGRVEAGIEVVDAIEAGDVIVRATLKTAG